MPCNGGNYFGGERTVYKESPEARQLIDLLTRRICNLCGIMEKHGTPIPKEIDEWWYEHKLEDAARTAEAKRRKEAMSEAARRVEYLQSVKERVMKQLSEDEKEALFLVETDFGLRSVCPKCGGIPGVDCDHE